MRATTLPAETAISRRLRERASNAPGGPALVTWSARQTRIWSWAELERTTGRVADALNAAAKQVGHCAVLLRSGPLPDALTAFLGFLRTDIPGAVLAGTATPQAEEAIIEALARRSCRVIRIVGEATSFSAGSRAVQTMDSGGLPPHSLLMMTGGSAGEPKTVINEWIRRMPARPDATRPSRAMNWRPGQTQLVSGPVHHAAALTFVIEGLADGNTLLIPQAFNSDEVLAAMGHWRAEWLQVTPYHLRQLGISLQTGHYDLSSVQGLLHMAAPCPDQLKRYWIDQIGADRVFEMYGMTEGIGVTLASGGEWLERPGTVGRGFFTQIRILDDDGRRMGVGQKGEIYMRSALTSCHPYLDASYVLNSTADGFFSVGDHGRVDADGYLYLAPRQLRRVQVGGETVDPADVETALMTHPLVIDAAVVGVPDERLGESLVALVEARGPCDARQLKAYLRPRLSPQQLPRTVRFVDRLPYAETGKLDRQQLAELA